MKKNLKKIIATAMASLIVVGGITTKATASELNIDDKGYDEITIEMMQKFPDFKKQLEESKGKVISSNESYIKFSKKPNVELKSEYTRETIAEDMEITYHTKDEYLAEQKKAKADPGFWQDSTQTSWMRLGTQVIENTYPRSTYMAYNFASWLTSPAFRYKDAIGIAVSDGVIIGDRGRVAAQYVAGNMQTGYNVNTVLSVNISKNGALAEGWLNTAPGIIGEGEYHDYMIQVPIEFINTNNTVGRIFGTYMHKQLSVGGVSIGLDGKPSPSIGSKYDKVEVSTLFRR